MYTLGVCTTVYGCAVINLRLRQEVKMKTISLLHSCRNSYSGSWGEEGVGVTSRTAYLAFLNSGWSRHDSQYTWAGAPNMNESVSAR